MSPDSQSPPKIDLGIKQRLKLIDTLNGLPISQLLQIEIALGVPKYLMPGLSAEQGIRTAELLRNLEVRQGKGFSVLLDVLRDLGIKPFDDDSNPSDSKDDDARQRLKLTLEGDFDELDRDKLKRLLAEIQDLAGDFSVQMSKISPGSIEIELDGPEDALERLKQLIDSHQVTQVAELQIQDASFVEIGIRAKGLNLRFAILEGANLQEADLSRADLQEANLRRTVLRGAILRGANLREVILQEADLREANLREAVLFGANLNSADLREANLRGANLREAILREAILREANLKRAILNSADLNSTDLREANLREAILNSADLNSADLREANLKRASLREANLSRSKLKEADLKGADLKETDLKEADLKEANLRGTNFREAILDRADFRGTNLFEADLRETTVELSTFGDNLGLTEQSKDILRRRGARIQDGPEFNPSKVLF